MTFFDRLLDTSGLVGFIVYIEIRINTSLVAILPKNPHAQGVKRADVRAQVPVCCRAHLLAPQNRFSERLPIHDGRVRGPSNDVQLTRDFLVAVEGRPV